MFEYFIYCYGNQLLTAILCAIFGCLGYAVKRLHARYVNDETKIAIARVVAQFVEQTWQTIHGPEKLQKALETAEIMLKKKGIDFDAEEMTVLIEAAVAEFNEAFKKPLAIGSIGGFDIGQTIVPNTVDFSEDVNAAIQYAENVLSGE